MNDIDVLEITRTLAGREHRFHGILMARGLRWPVVRDRLRRTLGIHLRQTS